MKRLEFGFFDAGGGHRAAATALKMAIEVQQRPWEVELANLQEILDPLDILKKFTGIRIQDLYNTMLRNGWTLGSPQLLKVLQLVVKIHHRGGVRLLQEYWRQTQPDMLVSFVPHFNRIMCESFGRVFPQRPFVTILTDLADYPPHFWIEERQSQYFVCGSDRAVRQALSMGHPENRIFRASGMILHPRFYEPQTADRAAGRQRLGFGPDLPTGLVLFGGYGSHEIREIADQLDRSSLELQLILICGKNAKLAQQLRRRKWRIPVFVEGFTTKVNEYMHLADFFVGKPGPGSVSEALEMHLPVIVACNSWTLPQERYNADYIVEKQVGVVLRSFRDIERGVAQLIEPSSLARYRANTVALENQAVFEIPAILEKIFERSSAQASSAKGALLAGKSA